MNLIVNMSSEITVLQLLPDLPGANGLNHLSLTTKTMTLNIIFFPKGISYDTYTLIYTDNSTCTLIYIIVHTH